MNRFFLPVINRTEKMSNRVRRLKIFAEKYFRNKRYSHGQNRGQLCTSFYILNPKIEDCETHYLLSDFTVAHDIIPVKDNEHKDFIFMNSYSNCKIIMNKNKTSDNYYNNRNNGTYNCFKVSSDIQYFNGYQYYPTTCGNMTSTQNTHIIYLTELYHFVIAEEWNRYESKYYFLVDPDFTPEYIQSLREEQRQQAEQKIQLAQEKIHDEVEKEDLENIYALYKDINDGKIKNMPNSMKKILLSYVSNVSENVQFHLQKEIKEIYKVLNNIKDDLELYVHNI